MIGVWTDSSLYGANGEQADPDLVEFERHALYSQGGALVGMMAQDKLESLGDVPVSLLDWRSRASKRVLHSTFAAESCAALEAIGLGIYLRA